MPIHCQPQRSSHSCTMVSTSLLRDLLLPPSPWRLLLLAVRLFLTGMVQSHTPSPCCLQPCDPSS